MKRIFSCAAYTKTILTNEYMMFFEKMLFGLDLRKIFKRL